MKLILDGEHIKNKDDFYNVIKVELEQQIAASIGSDEMGDNLDAVYDLLTDIEDRLEIVISNKEAMFSDEEGYYDRFMRMLRTAANQNSNITIDFEEDGDSYTVFTVTTKSGMEVEMAVLDEFEFEHKPYVVCGQVKGDEVDEENIFIYKVKVTEDDFDVEQIKSAVEYERIGKAYLEMLEEA